MKIHIISLILPLALLIAGCSNQADSTQSEETEKTTTATEKAEAPPISEQQAHSYTERGKFIALATFAKLNNSLLGAMQDGGAKSAIPFCNVKAYPLTDSISDAMGVRIRRTSLQYRNPKNAPTAEEKEILENFANIHAGGGALKPVLKPYGQDSVTFYGPMIIMDLCLQCHGVAGETLSPEAPELLSTLYPEDKATGYQNGDLRGIWSIRMER